MPSTPESQRHAAQLFIEFGAAILGLAVLSRLAHRFRFSAIPLYLLAGLAFGTGGVLPLNVSEQFIRVGAEIGLLMLLFMLGLEYTGDQLRSSMKRGFVAGLLDLSLNFPPGFIAGLLLGWGWLPSVLLGGITYISSSGVISKLLSDLKRTRHPETTHILSVLVIEDLAMAIYLPLVAVLLAGGGAGHIAVSVAIAVVTVSLILVVAIKAGPQVSRLVGHDSDEAVLLTTFGTVLLVGGIAQQLQVSAAIGAFLVGIALSGPLAKQSHQLLSPLRDLFAATFFFFFGLQIDPSTLPAILPVALALGAVTAATKVLSGYLTAKRAGLDRYACLRAGTALIARGEFSIVIAGLGAQVQPQLNVLSAGYVLFLALLGPAIARFVPDGKPENNPE